MLDPSLFFSLLLQERGLRQHVKPHRLHRRIEISKSFRPCPRLNYERQQGWSLAAVPIVLIAISCSYNHTSGSLIITPLF